MLIDDYKKIVYCCKHLQCWSLLKDLHCEMDVNNTFYAYFRKIEIGGHWFRFFDNHLKWESEKEGFQYWYKKQLQLTYCAILIDNKISKTACDYLNNLMGRYSHSKWSYIIKNDFIHSVKKQNIISKEIIDVWERTIKKMHS